VVSRRLSSANVLALIALGGLAFAAPSEAKASKEAAFKLLSASGTQTHTFQEQESEYYGNACVGTQSQSVRYHSTQPAKMYVFIRRAHGLHTLVSDKPDPDSGLEALRVTGEMTLSKSVSYSETRGCRQEPAECPETTFSAPVIVYGTHNPSGGIMPLYDQGLDLPSGLDRTCQPYAHPRYGPLSRHAVPPDLEEIPGAIPRSEIFDERRKRLSGEDSTEFSYETTTDPEFSYQTTVTGTWGETIAVKLRRLRTKR
jgi:hypothetical protein